MAENDIKIEDLSEEQMKLLQLDPVQAFDLGQKATFQADQALGITAGAITAKTIDNTVINDYISKIETPTGGDVYSKQAAMYRAQGEGALLRTQRDLRNLFLPTIDLIQKREAAAMARFTLLKNRMPEFDDTTIFGDQSDNPMPVADEIKNISAQTKEDLRMLSRLSPNDERYEEIKNRVEINQKSIVEFDAVNKKLLEIRNSGTDESQWSKGMDPTTINMWKDIYTSNGKNIKIQDGKLVWTDEKGTNIYDIPDDNTVGGRDVYDDETYDILINTRGDDTNSEQYKRADALSTLHWYGDQDLEGNDPGSDYGEKSAKDVQESLNALGITDNDGNAIEVDGKFGPKTREAFKKYLKVRGKLNKQHLDQYMTEEDAAKYRSTSGVGETKIIDLSQIGDGPTTIHDGAVNQDIKIRGNAQNLINQGVGVDDPMYNTLIKKEIATLNDVGPDGIKSLIFDGLRNDEDSIYAGMNTDTFLEQVISQHYGNDLSATEIEKKIQLMRSQDVTQMYNNGKGGQDTLQTQFLEWYKKQIDQKIIEGKKSEIVSTQPIVDDPTSDPSSGGGSGTAILNNQLGSALQDNAVVYTYGSRGVQPYSVNNNIEGISLQNGEIGLAGKDLALILKNDKNNKRQRYYKKFDQDTIDMLENNDTYKLGTDNILYVWDKDYNEWVKSRFKPNSYDPSYVFAYQRVIEALNNEQNALNIISGNITTFDKLGERWELITKGGETKWTSPYTKDVFKKQNFLMYNDGRPKFDSIKHKGTMLNDFVLDYKDDELVIQGLEKGYGIFGFSFKDAGYDKIDVYFTDTDGKRVKISSEPIKTNFITDVNKRRRVQENRLIEMMKNAWNNSNKKKVWFSKVKLAKDDQNRFVEAK